MMKSLRTFSLLSAATLLFAGIGFAQPTTMKGVVSDQMCGAKHMMAGNSAKCTRECVKMGSSYALVVGDKVYVLKGHDSELSNLAGQAVTVKGTLAGTTLNVASVAAAK
jgi:hypothetical protein